jgi:hypothetical protein
MTQNHCPFSPLLADQPKEKAKEREKTSKNEENSKS